MADDAVVVKFVLPEGATAEILGGGDFERVGGLNAGSEGYALRLGRAYRVRIANLPHREPTEALYPSLDVVGHLHRPADVPGARFPVRIEITEEDVEDVLNRGQLVTHAYYLESPDEALPISVKGDEIPSLEVTSSENPVEVARKLGRVMIVARIGQREPSPTEMDGALAGIGPEGLVGGRCPFGRPEGGLCGLPCGPGSEAYFPKAPVGPLDEYLCDGGDRDDYRRPGESWVRGVDPRDTVLRFFDGKAERTLPTNKVCVYAPRFAKVKGVTGIDASVLVQTPTANETLAGQETMIRDLNPTPLVKNDAVILARHRLRPSGLSSRIRAQTVDSLAILEGVSDVKAIGGFVDVLSFRIRTGKVEAAVDRRTSQAVGIKSAESAVVTGLVEGLGQMILSRPPLEVSSDEPMDRRPGIATVKTVDVETAESGDVVTFAIRYKNIGNVPIRLISVTDSLLPRLEFVPGSAEGPEGAIFTTAPNRAGSLELRWEIPGELKPGEEGIVTFRATVR